MAARPCVRGRAARAVAAAILICAALSGCSGPAPTPVLQSKASAGSNVLLVTIDTLRGDSLGWVAGLNETPAIDALAREGFALTTVVSPVPLTLPAQQRRTP